MWRTFSIPLLGALLVGLGPAVAPATAQDAAGRGKLVEIKVVGSKEYTDEEIVRASGLEKGKIVSSDDFQAAARRLAKTGAFSHVSTRYGFLGPNVLLTLVVQDAEVYESIRYENFVWAKDAELTAYLRGRVPLFHGRVAHSDDMLHGIEAALNEWLAAHEVKGTVTTLMQADGSPKKDTVMDTVSFLVLGVSLKIRGVEWIDAPNLDPSRRAEAATLLVGSDYQASTVGSTLALAAGKSYRGQGRLRARTEAPQLRLTPAAPGVDIALVVPVKEGPVYRLGKVDWKGASAEEMAAKLRGKPGEVADGVRLDEDLAEAQKTFVSHGYMKARLIPSYLFHDEQATVDFVITVEPGPLFHMGTLTLEGLPEEARKKVSEAWKLKPGEVYDPDYFIAMLNDGGLPHSILTHLRMTSSLADGDLVNVVLRYE